MPKLCPERGVAVIYVPDALKDSWVLGTDWTIEMVDEKLAALDTTSAVVPGNYTSATAWLEKVEELAGKAPEETEPESDDEDAF